MHFHTGHGDKFYPPLVDYLRSNYIHTRYIPEGKEWPPNQPKYYVNLAVVHYQGSQTQEEVIFCAHHNEHTNLAIDNELLFSSITNDQSRFSDKFQITREIVDLFKKDLHINDSSKEGDISTNLSKSILIEGAPGIGKTILLKEVAYRWANGTILLNAIIVFLIYLRDSRFQLVSTINDLIEYFDCLDKNEIPVVVKQLKKSNGEGVVFLFDGLDEYPDALQNGFLSRLIDRKILSNCVFVIASRPCASLTLHNKIERRIEILGFGNEERDEYISKSLKSFPERKEKLEIYLKQHTMLNSLVYIPFHLSVLLFLFQQGNLPETLTEMNEYFILHTVYRHMEKHGILTTCIVKLGDLPKNVHNIIYKLSRLAFEGLQKNQLVFTFDEIKQVCPEVKNIPGALNGFGLLQAVQHYPVKGAGVTVSFNFLHLTMQEFLAAWYVSHCSIEEQKRLLKQSFMNTKSWDELSNSNARMWQMYVGIVGVNCDAWMQFTYENNLTLSAIKDPLNYLYYLQCLVEGKCDNLDFVSSPFKNSTINFYCRALIPYDMVLLCLFLSKSSEYWNYYILTGNAIGDVEIKILTNFLLLNTKLLLRITTLDLSFNRLTSQSASAIHDVILEGALITLKLYCNFLGEKSTSKISQALKSNVTVKTLGLSCNNIGVNGAKTLAVALYHNRTLEHLFINNNEIMDDGAVAICECFKIKDKRLSSIKSLNLAFNILTSCSITAITTAIQEGALTLLDLSSNDLGDNGVYEISKALQVNLTIKQLFLHKSNIGVRGALSLAVALCHNHTLEDLHLYGNKILDDGAIAFGESLKTNRTLKYLDIAQNNITEIGATDLAEVFKCNPVLKTLNISGKEYVEVFKPDRENLVYNETIGRHYRFVISNGLTFDITLNRVWIKN